MRVLIVVTHLQGVGHLSRAAAIGRALVRAGHRVTIASGGLAVPTVDLAGSDLVELPPARIEDNDFSRLLDGEGRPVDTTWWATRRGLLEAALGLADPDILVTEHYPFGRRPLAAEFDALVARARALNPRTRLVASVRDVLVPPRNAENLRQAEERLARFDGVLVHGDPDFLPLEASWPVSPEVAAKLRYTGYVLEHEREIATSGEAGEILVSAGGGATGRPLFEAAIGAARLWPEGPPWRVLVGSRLPGQAPEGWASPGRNVTVEPARSDFRSVLGGCAVSVSRGGYNTVVEVLDAGVRAIIVPFHEGRETEQRRRAQVLAEHGLVDLLPEPELTPEALLARVRAALAGPPPSAARPALDGLVRTVTALEAFCSGKADVGVP